LVMAQILILGSLAEDQVVSLRCALQPGRHLEGEQRGRRLGGGAANTGGALARAGHRVMLVSAVGDDDTGCWLLRELDAIGLDLSLVRVVEGRSTRSLVMIAGVGERSIVNLSRVRQFDAEEGILQVSADCLYVRSQASDLAPLLKAKSEQCLVVAQMPPCGAGARPARVLVASESDLSPELRRDPFGLGRRVAGEILQWVVVTSGPRGATAFGRDETLVAAAPVVDAVDTTGAGDAFAAGLVHALVTGRPMKEALAVACAWGAESTRWESSVVPAEAMRRLL